MIMVRVRVRVMVMVMVITVFITVVVVGCIMTMVEHAVTVFVGLDTITVVVSSLVTVVNVTVTVVVEEVTITVVVFGLLMTMVKVAVTVVVVVGFTITVVVQVLFRQAFTVIEVCNRAVEAAFILARNGLTIATLRPVAVKGIIPALKGLSGLNGSTIAITIAIT